MLRGYRGWKVRTLNDQPILVSPAHTNRVWWPGENIACCELCEGGPSEECSCGFYSLKEPGALLTEYASDIIGQVLIWGKTIEGDLGYRSKYAQVSLFLIPSIEPFDEELLEQLSFKYNAPLIKAEGTILRAISATRRKRLIQRGKLPLLAAIDLYKKCYAWKNKREYVPDYKTHNTNLE